MKKLSILFAVAASVGLASFVLVGAQDPAQEAPAEPPTSGSIQPIGFRHDVHAGTYEMSCQYCHYSAERSVDAGLPSVQDCIGCHLAPMPGESNQAETDKIRDYWNRREPIPWVRIYKISDHAHFPHMRHVAAGLDCAECHGDMTEVAVLEERNPVWGGDNMGWCVTCHVSDANMDGEPDAARDCTVCHY